MSAPARALGGLKHRRDFLAAARARKAATDSIILQDRTRADGDNAVRLGFTASKKVGNAVARNRAKRRMKAVARDVFANNGEAGHDYVLIARRNATTTLPFEKLRDDLTRALERIQKGRKH